MHGFFARMISFFLSVFLFFGPFGKSAEVINMVPVDALSLTNIDITDGFAVTVPAASGTVHFNRVSFSYAASAAVRTVFVYRQGVNVREEELLLTSGAHSASMLLDGYLRRKTASRLLSVRFEPIVSGQNCVLSVSDFNCAVQDVPKGDTMYIENSRYKAGVSLKWGGGLCFFEDKQDDRYGNLLNNHDTGRLVQQSYYGPTQIDGYENGVFMGSVWGYNPVQGGDQFGNNSKLVAVEKDEKEIRVVCRPLDWALDNMPTQTYYTNVYRLTDAGLSLQDGSLKKGNIFVSKIFDTQLVDIQAVLYEMSRCVHMGSEMIGQCGNKAAEWAFFSNICTLLDGYYRLTRPCITIGIQGMR